MKKTFLLFVVFMSFISCQKQIQPIYSNIPPISFTEVFDQFWGKMKANYVYWDIDTTNWNEIYNTYRPLFQKLNLQNDNDVKRSVRYFRKMTDGLIDSHYLISFTPSSIQDSFVFPSLDRKLESNSFHKPFLYVSIDTNYFDHGFLYGTYITKDNRQIYALSGTIQNRILYFSCNQFSLLEAYQATNFNGVKTVLNYFFEKISQTSTSMKGLIIDVRNNSGGNVSDLNFFIGRMIDKPLLFGYARYKSGIGSLDYTPWIDAKILPHLLGKKIDLPLVVLADNYSVSLAEAALLAIKAMPNSIFIGEKTWGATGPITDNSIYNDGAFNVPNFLSVFTSSAAFKYIDNKIYEGTGFPPDIFSPFNFIGLLNKKDSQLEDAINLIH